LLKSGNLKPLRPVSNQRTIAVDAVPSSETQGEYRLALTSTGGAI